MKELLEKKLIIFGGKGGVGKTTIAAATAVKASETKKVLILSTDPAHSLGDSFGKTIGGKITKIQENLDALEIDSEKLLKNFLLQKGEFIKKAIEEGTFFSKQDLDELFNLSLPGLDEVMSLLEIIRLMKSNEYDLFIFDTAPSGHTIRLLESPDIMLSWIKVLFEMRKKHIYIISKMFKRYVKDETDLFLENFHKDLIELKNRLRNSEFVPITIPEEMSICETSDLVAILKKYKIPVSAIIVNGIIPESECKFCDQKRSEQLKRLTEINELFPKYKIKKVPLFESEVRKDSLKVLAGVLYDDYSYKASGKKGSIREIKHDKLDAKILEKKILLFGGKGGVGKTTLAASTALEAAKQRKVLIFSTDPAHSLSDSFEKEIGNKITEIAPHLDALEIDAKAAFEDFKSAYRKEITGFFNSLLKKPGASIDFPFDRKIMTDLFELVPPGIDELMAMTKIADLIEEGKYDTFVLDTAPTGHTIRFLETPVEIGDIIKVIINMQKNYLFSLDSINKLEGIMEKVDVVKKILTDPEQSEFISVSIPEAMGLLETQRLVKKLKEMSIHSSYLIMNKISSSGCSFCSTRRANEEKYIESSLKIVEIPLFSYEVKGLAKLSALADMLF